jgi:hypothetical protein
MYAKLCRLSCRGILLRQTSCAAVRRRDPTTPPTRACTLFVIRRAHALTLSGRTGGVPIHAGDTLCGNESYRAM